MKHINLLTGHSRGKPVRYILEIQEAPAWKVIRGNIYHWYDMQKWMWPLQRVVGKLMEKIHPQKLMKEPDPSFPIENNTPWEMRQDFRCYSWNNHPVVFQTDIDHETFTKLGGRG